MAEWIGITQTTRAKYLKGASDLTLRKRLLLALLKKRGRIEYNQAGDQCKWQVEFSQPAISSYGDGGVIDFSNHNKYKQLSNDWRAYIGTDTLSMKQSLMNKGEEALISQYQNKMNGLTRSLSDKFCGELYKDGHESGRENNVHGLETFMGAGTVAAGDRVAQNSDSYGLGALSTAQAAEGGSWTAAGTANNSALATDWPDGSGDSEYDYLSAKLVNWSSTAWGTSSALWEDNCWRVVGQAKLWLQMTGGSGGSPDMCVLAGNLFQGYKNHEEAIRRINIPHKMAEDLGFGGDTLNQDGLAIQADFDCPINTGYMINASHITLSCLTPQLFWSKGPDIDPRSAYSYLWAVGFFGNVKYQPKHFAKLKNYA